MNYVMVALLVVLMTALHALAKEKASDADALTDDDIDKIEMVLSEVDSSMVGKSLERTPTAEIVQKIALRKDNTLAIKPFIEDKKVKMSPDAEAKDDKTLSETEEQLTDEQ